MKAEMKVEIEKLDGINTRVQNDFKRINSYITVNTKLMKRLLED